MRIMRTMRTVFLVAGACGHLDGSTEAGGAIDCAALHSGLRDYCGHESCLLRPEARGD
jgi:hypothetical protein